LEQDSVLSKVKRVLGLSLWTRLFKPPNIEEQIQHLIDAGEEAGTLSELEGEMIEGVLELRDTVARELMVPRTEMVCIRAGASGEEIIHLIKSTGHSRYPVYENDIDNIVGILHVKDLISKWGPGEEYPDLGQIIRPPYFISENMRTVDILKEFQSKRFHMAIVTDEYGGISGLITIEDILEEIVGDIRDEHDKEETRIQTLDDGTVLVDARVDVEELEDYLHIELPKGDYASVGGFLINLAGKVPQTGEVFEFDSLEFRVDKADPRKIEKINIRPLKNLQSASSAH
jgi:CBS domain containing-hemolysin-like protein